MFAKTVYTDTALPDISVEAQTHYAENSIQLQIIEDGKKVQELIVKNPDDVRMFVNGLFAGMAYMNYEMRSIVSKKKV